MYLFARQAVLRDLEAGKWSVDIGAAAAGGLGVDVGVWANALSPGFGTTTWISMWSDLGALEKAFAALSSDATYLALVARGHSSSTAQLTTYYSRLSTRDPPRVASPGTSQLSPRCARRANFFAG